MPGPIIEKPTDRELLRELLRMNAMLSKRLADELCELPSIADCIDWEDNQPGHDPADGSETKPIVTAEKDWA